ncbi:60S ribosomal protein L9-B [Curvularia clavata]|uniref:60S ribosomal protein L9-B n=1 Tax=Curvularia clavata TaxID=95742 RepID=A0A9Q8Z4H0_CURCL|nr:60S ribosomal protein L9-B [Curvularia clavata]
MKYIHSEEELPVPEGVKVQIKNRNVVVEGPRGKLTKSLGHLAVSFTHPKKDLIKIELHHGSRKSVATLRTVRTLINNLIIGVTKGYKYKMRYVYAQRFPMYSVQDSPSGIIVAGTSGTSDKPNWTRLMADGTQSDLANMSPSFPINVNLEKNNETGCWEVEIRNFIGEKLVRRVVLRPGVEVEASKNVKDQLELSGNSLEDVSQGAADIQQICKVRNKDIRKFLDGLYVSERGNIVEDA